MAAYFLDSSALIKRYVQERGTAWIRASIDPAAGHHIFAARLALVEVAATTDDADSFSMTLLPSAPSDDAAGSERPVTPPAPAPIAGDE
jgi:cell division protein FtsW (lipid II flippase)